MEINKQSNIKDKISFLKKNIKKKALKNEKILINILYLIKQLPKKKISDFFKNENIIYNNIMELMDIKLSMKKELDIFKKKLLKIHFCILKSIGIQNQERSKHLDNIFFLIYPYITEIEWANMIQQNNISINFSKIPTICNVNVLMNLHQKYSRQKF